MLTSVKKSCAYYRGFLRVTRRDWSVIELSLHLDMPQPTIHHFLSSLKELGWITQDRSSKRYKTRNQNCGEIGCSAINFREVTESARSPSRCTRG